MAVSMSRSNFPSCDGANSVSYLCWKDISKKPKAALQISHGMAEYAARYDDFAKFLVSCGYVVYANDHLGHGDTARSEDDFGYFAEKDGYKLIVSDMHKLTEIIKSDYPGLPVILLGHSMGSFLARNYSISYSKDIDAAIYMGTSGPNPAGGAGIFLVDLISLFKGERHRSPFVNNVAFGSYNKTFTDVETDFDWLSVNRDNVRKYVADKKCGFLFTLSGFRDLFKLLGSVSKQDWADGIRKDLPVLLISGHDDPVGSYGKGVETVYTQLRGAEIKDVTVKLFDGKRHEILNESDNREVFDYLVNWCDKRIK